jgi:hypothetical protein
MLLALKKRKDIIEEVGFAAQHTINNVPGS